MNLQAAINGARTRAEHPAVPLTPDEQAREAAAAVAAGATSIHVHVRDSSGRESLRAGDVARCLDAIRAVCRVPIGVSSGAWIAANAAERHSLIEGWIALPDFVSVNLHEEGALPLIQLLRDRGVGVEAGVWNAQAARFLRDHDLAPACLRVLLEPAEDGRDAIANLEEIEKELAHVAVPRLLHGLDASAWQLIAVARARGYDTRVGLEDTLRMPDGSRTADNAALVTAAMKIDRVAKS